MNVRKTDEIIKHKMDDQQCKMELLNTFLKVNTTEHKQMQTQWKANGTKQTYRNENATECKRKCNGMVTQ